MGLSKKPSGSTFDCDHKSYSCKCNSYRTTNVAKLPNPDPKNYKIVRYVVIGKFLILKINYPDCINYEGNKVLLFKNVKLESLLEQKGGIDPHFSNNFKKDSPIARFEPTVDGWNMAVDIANLNTFFK